jgi:hypothetical protein
LLTLSPPEQKTIYKSRNGMTFIKGATQIIYISSNVRYIGSNTRKVQYSKICDTRGYDLYRIGRGMSESDTI